MREIAERGSTIRAADYCKAIDFERLEAARIMQHWTEMDVLATPTLTKLPLRNGLVPAMADFDERWTFCIDWHSFTLPFNITGQPAISVPARTQPGRPARSGCSSSADRRRRRPARARRRLRGGAAVERPPPRGRGGGLSASQVPM